MHISHLLILLDRHPLRFLVKCRLAEFEFKQYEGDIKLYRLLPMC